MRLPAPDSTLGLLLNLAIAWSLPVAAALLTTAPWITMLGTSVMLTVFAIWHHLAARKKNKGS